MSDLQIVLTTTVDPKAVNLNDLEGRLENVIENELGFVCRSVRFHEVCPHNQLMNAYCEPCGRINGSVG